MRILYLNASGQMGGAETSLITLMASVMEARPDWELCVVVGQEGPMVEKARRIGARTFILPFPPAVAELGDAGEKPLATVRAAFASVGATLAYARRLRILIRNIQPAVIHSNGFKTHVLSSLVRPRRASLIWHMHDYAGARPVVRRLLRPLQSRCDAAVANSKSVAADLAQVFPGMRVATIYNAIDLRRFGQAGKILDLDAASGFSLAAPDAIRVGMVATFARWKGHEVFLRAMSLVPRDLPIRGYVIGGPIYQTKGSQYSLRELEDMAEKFGVRDRIGFTGFLDEPEMALRALDVVVHASTKPEPFGMAIIEAMGCGKPVIASQAGGAGELFVDGVTAVGHTPGDFHGLAQQIERLARDELLRSTIGRSARRAVEQNFRMHRLAEELLPLYEYLGDRANQDIKATNKALRLDENPTPLPETGKH